MSSAILTDSLSKSYGSNHALQPTSLSVPAGAVYALVGHNGAGKTTLIKILMNIIAPSTGSATVLGMPATSLTGAAFERIGYVSENQDLPLWMTVGQFLDYLAPFYPKWNLGDLLERFDLPRNRKLKHLSRGMLMKASLASTLAFSPELIVMDEPFSGLDPLVRDELIEALVAHTRSTGATVLISSHDLGEIEAFATHVGFIHQGQFLFNEELTTLTSRFREVTVAFAPITTPAADGGPATITPPVITFPPTKPEHWLNIENLGTAVRYTNTAADTVDSHAEAVAAFPGAASVQVMPMNLRSIFLVLAKSGRVPATPVVAVPQGGAR